MKALQVKELQHHSKLKVILQSQGKYQNQPPLPFVLGAEFAGKIASDSPIPDGCDFKRGDRVFGYAQGAYSERLALNPVTLLPVPANISLEQAAGLFLTYPTSYEALVGRAQAKAGETVLVLAGAGGVGLAAVQIAKYLGCKVIAAVGSEAKFAVCKNAGADHVINYSEAGWQNKVKELTDGDGVDVVYDPVGMIVPSLKCVNWNARLVVVGFAAGTIEKIPANLILLKNVSVVGLFWGATSYKDPARFQTVIKEVLTLIAKGKLNPTVYEKVYEGIGGVVEGLSDIEGRKTWGKAVVRIRREDKGKL
ncbi:hypothetical protein A1Q1_06778 [Trichosporon asahii var. asahii CBS 2479]|uniref:Enoyl reductase (ER) domain-containing protein n=1 Tax=Trichosporon asahii var. asahii (strain ATCC 90039 / CBS 2479 / JCM 2466 / KCTC 7840 / NBRC 103889/ NCYC 2677 / UAMH 7654) TaxID=1186058 RepID=J6F9P6_TRIAS|nr:hypothetical protein A1Q1_06778 [Trichosporon asahii var. asahii CBS 2479]EJT51972.1 hypothetical protein A1Q1_06778 [Trichosporon asahii var. asahii CBS 2479]